MVGQSVLIEIRLFKATESDGEHVFWAQTEGGSTCCGRKHDHVAEALECFAGRCSKGRLRDAREPWGERTEGPN